MTTLLVAFWLGQIGQVLAAYGVWINFNNDCRRGIRVYVYGDESGTVILGPYESGSFTLCSSLCTGFLGAGKSYYYSYEAETDDYTYDCTWGLKVRIIALLVFG